MTDKSQRIEELEQRLQALQMRLDLVEGTHAVFLADILKQQMKSPQLRQQYRDRFFQADGNVEFLYPKEALDILNRILDRLVADQQ